MGEPRRNGRAVAVQDTTCAPPASTVRACDCPPRPRRPRFDLMRKIHKVDTRTQATGYGWAAVIMGDIFVMLGGYLALAGFEVLPLPGKANAPLWLIAS